MADPRDGAGSAASRRNSVPLFVHGLLEYGVGRALDPRALPVLVRPQRRATLFSVLLGAGILVHRRR